MAGVEDELAAYLAAAGLGLTVSVNLFTNPFPVASAEVDPMVCFDVYGGRPSDRTFGALSAELPHFHIFIRGAIDGADDAKALAHLVYKKLDNLGPITLSGVAYRDVRSLDGPPKFFGRDKTQRPIYVLNFEADKDQS